MKGFRELRFPDRKRKELLLKDLCARLPYGVKVKKGDKVRTVRLIDIIGEGAVSFIEPDFLYIFNQRHMIKPYLRPMSSMTKEEEKIFNDFLEFQAEYVSDFDLSNKVDMYDWLNAHHFDYRDLIKKDLALEAPEGMYKIE